VRIIMLFMSSVSQRIKNLLRVPVFDQKGQSIIIFVFAFLGLIAMLGLALDLGLVYIERTRIKRAVDAATLAAVVELPSEEKAMLRAINYLDENGYRLRSDAGQPQVNIYIRGCAHGGYLDTASPLQNRGADLSADPYLYFPPNGVPAGDPIAEFTIDTRSYQSRAPNGDPLPGNDPTLCSISPPSTDILGTANKIHVDGTVPVGMNFMQFFGRREQPVSDESIAQNVTSLDVVVVFDMSGSMQFDTNGYGFYEPYGDGTTAWTTLNYGHDYPLETFKNRIPTDHLPKGTMTSATGGVGNNEGKLCWQRDSNTVEYHTISGGGDTRRYVVIEAELYSLNTSLLAGSFRQPGRGYWAVQHTNWRTIDRMMGTGGGSYSTDATPILPSYSRGSWVSHHPYVSWAIEDQVPFGHDYTLTEVRNGPFDTPPGLGPLDVPSLEYDFVTAGDWDDGGDTSIWVRAQGQGNWGTGNRRIYWAVYDYTDLQTNAVNWETPSSADDPAALGSGQIERIRQDGSFGASYGGARAGSWQWRELTGNSTRLDLENSHRYTLKIWAGGVGYDIDQIVIGNEHDTSFTNNYGGGATDLEATAGSAFRQACNRCNPIYGRTVNQVECVSPTDNGNYDTFMVPNGVTGRDLSDPGVNPLYSGYEPIRGSKEAVKRFIAKLDPQFDQVGLVSYSTNMPAAGRVEMRCRRYLSADQCFQGTNPISFTQVLNRLEILPPNGSTNMAGGMLRGLEALGIDATNMGASFDNSCSTDTSHCGRGGSARRVMIVMSDGVANQNPGGACTSSNLYDGNANRDCVIYYGQIAGANNVTIYTIGLGNGVDEDLMTTVAELPGSNGEYFYAPSPAQLDGIFEAILQSISVRLIE
jgi:hypothetical protein